MALTKNKIGERKIHNVLGILAQHFRDGAYDEGWSDVRIAKETGIPKLLVTETRQWRVGPTATVRASGSRVPA